MPRSVVQLSALRHNLTLLREPLGGHTALLAAVKANAYGHGAVPVARELEECGVGWFGVATPEEALELRGAGIGGRILLLGPVYRSIAQLQEAGIEFTVADRVSLSAITGSGAPGRARVHVKVDTGMGRIGRSGDAALEVVRFAADATGVDLCSVWTHFASADVVDRSSTLSQIAEFEALLERLRAQGIRPPAVHACNSAGLLGYPQAHYDLVRPGIALYGYAPPHSQVDLLPVMHVSAPVTFVKRVPAGTPISYGSTWRSARETTVATVRFGYADGYHRRLSNLGWVGFSGQRLPVVGTVTMDQLMVDAGDIDIAPGDRVELIGGGGPDAAELAEMLGTISYELLTSISARVAREYQS